MPSFWQLWETWQLLQGFHPHSLHQMHTYAPLISILSPADDILLYPPAVCLPIRFLAYLHDSQSYPLCCQFSHHPEPPHSPEVALLFFPQSTIGFPRVTFPPFRPSWQACATYTSPPGYPTDQRHGYTTSSPVLSLVPRLGMKPHSNKCQKGRANAQRTLRKTPWIPLG